MVLRTFYCNWWCLVFLSHFVPKVVLTEISRIFHSEVPIHFLRAERRGFVWSVLHDYFPKKWVNWNLNKNDEHFFYFWMILNAGWHNRSSFNLIEVWPISSWRGLKFRKKCNFWWIVSVKKYLVVASGSKKLLLLRLKNCLTGSETAIKNLQFDVPSSSAPLSGSSVTQLS